MKKSRQRNKRWRTQAKTSKNVLHSYSRQGTRAQGKIYERPWHNLKQLDDDATVTLGEIDSD